MSAPPKILVFDSGLGGLTVLSECQKARPDAAFTYVADDVFFPYGRLNEHRLTERVTALMEELIGAHRPDLVVVACNTASTLVMGPLRARFQGIEFVGTVPAIKTAATRSRSRLISVLATPGTVARDYTRDLVRAYASDCEVTLVGSHCLAELAERHIQGEPIPDQRLRAEIEPCFVELSGWRTDMVVLACTHYPLLAQRFRAIAPWPVEWIDPAPAIARRVADLLSSRLGFSAVRGAQPSGGTLRFASGRPVDFTLQKALRQWRLEPVVSAQQELRAIA